MDPSWRVFRESRVVFHKYRIRRRFEFLIIALLLLISLFTIFSFNSPKVSAQATGLSSPLTSYTFEVTAVNSSSWAGYALNSSVVDSVTQIKGSWIVPQVNCSGVSGERSIAIVVAIDGYSGNSVTPRDGFIIESTCEGGVAYYPASYYHGGSYTFFNYTAPGDILFMKVRYSNGEFHLTYDDVTSGFSRTFVVSDPSAARQTAEWMLTMVSSPLLNFRSAFSGRNSTGLAGTDNAIIGGSSGTIGSFSGSPTVDIVLLNMVNSTSHGFNVQPTRLISAGSSFCENQSSFLGPLSDSPFNLSGHC